MEERLSALGHQGKSASNQGPAMDLACNNVFRGNRNHDREMAIRKSMGLHVSERSEESREREVTNCWQLSMEAFGWMTGAYHRRKVAVTAALSIVMRN